MKTNLDIFRNLNESFEQEWETKKQLKEQEKQAIEKEIDKT